MDSCNPVSIQVGQRLGSGQIITDTSVQFGLHTQNRRGSAGRGQRRSCTRKENMGPVELATVSFGQSFQITPIQLAATVSWALINGGTASDTALCSWQYQSPDGQTKAEELVLSSGAGDRCQPKPPGRVREHSGKGGISRIRKKCRDPGLSLLAGKQQHPRHCPEVPARYRSSFLGFAPAEQKSSVCWACALFTIPRECITEAAVAAPVIRTDF